MKDLEDTRSIAVQKEILEELYHIRSSLSKELHKLGEHKTGAHSATTGVDAQTLEELYKIRENLNGEIQKHKEHFDTTTQKMNFRIDHLKKNLLELLEENARIKKENEELKNKK